MIPCPDCGGSLELELEDFDHGDEEQLYCQAKGCGAPWTEGQLRYVLTYPEQHAYLPGLAALQAWAAEAQRTALDDGSGQVVAAASGIRARGVGGET